VSRKRRKHPDHSAVRKPTRPTVRHLQAVPDPEPRPGGSAYDQALVTTFRRALRSGSPLSLLMTVSQLMNLLDPRGADPFDKAEQRPTLEEIAGSFSQFDIAETTAALGVIVALSPDNELRADLLQTLARRHQPMPEWLTGLDRAEVTRVFVMKHLLGDGDDYFLECALAGGQLLTALVYVDHNLGTVVKDAFVIDESFDALLDTLATKQYDQHTTVTRFDHAEARAILDDAIMRGGMFWPPIESDDWPECRPLVEWLVRLLPPGAPPPPDLTWSEEQLDALRDEFFESSYGSHLDLDDEHDLMDDLNFFGSGWAGGDAMRWSPVKVEMLLDDWALRKIEGEPEKLTKLPLLLRAFIRYCAERRAMPPELTDETLAAVDVWEPSYQQAIRSSRLQGAEALVAGLLETRVDESIGDYMVTVLSHAVGGRTVLMSLGTEPLPDEQFSWVGIPEDIRPRVREVLEVADRCADELFDVEHRTAFRRFLGRAAAGDPGIFRRKGSVTRAAAAVCWAVCRANDSVGVSGRLQSQELLAWFEVKGSISERAEVFLRALGLGYESAAIGMNLETPDLLVAERRAALIERRDHFLSLPDDW
jgi:hypothetical protein